jgi:hypothetical protein
MQKSDAEARRMIAEPVEGSPDRFRYMPVLKREERVEKVESL